MNVKLNLDSIAKIIVATVSFFLSMKTSIEK